MANPEHLEVVKQGAEVIQKWRDANPNVSFDLRDADLCEEDLSWANLSWANLMGAHLNQADLTGAHLYCANLIDAKLWRSVLIGADLTYADLTHADLSGADLSEASFNESDFLLTFLGELDLSVARGLETVQHPGPNYIAIETLRLSRGRIPEVFLRGSGFEPWEALAAKLYDPSLSPHQISELQCRIFAERTKGYFLGGAFISYSHQDSEFVEKVYERFQREGANVWLDRHDMVAGPMQKQVFDAIRMNDIVLLVLSESSINSDWVENELEMARRKEKEQKRDVLCPVALDACWKEKVQDLRSDDRHLWRTLTKKNILDFSGWRADGFEEPFRKLVEGIKRYYGPKVPS